MSNFSVRNLTTRTHTSTDGALSPSQVGVVSEVNYQASADSYAITAQTPDVCVLTGSGNDTINASRATGNVAIDAGSGMNFIMGGKGSNIFSAEASSAATRDTISGFHMGDLFTLNGSFALNWTIGTMGATLTATQADAAPVSVTFMGLSDPSAFFTAVGHAGAQINIGLHA